MTVTGKPGTTLLMQKVQEQRIEIIRFLSSQPENWQEPQGKLTASERRRRLDLCAKYASDPLLDWMGAHNVPDFEVLVDSHADIDRQEFCELLSGSWFLEETGH